MNDITVDIQSSIDQETIINQIPNWTKLVLNQIDIRSSHIDVLIVDVKEGEYYNMVFRKRPGPTNVLSFPEDNNSGLIVLCDEVIQKESMELDRTVEERYFQVYSHGVLHLCGYTHDFDEDTQIMESIEDNLFEMFKKNKS